jgi:hypothetical protein
MSGGKSYEPFNSNTAWDGPLLAVPSRQGREVFRAFMQFYARELYIRGKRAKPLSSLGFYVGFCCYYH